MLGIALGDPAGVGPEIVARAWEARNTHALQPFFAIGACQAIAAAWPGPIAHIEDPAEARRHFSEALPCLHVGDSAPVLPGTPTAEGAEAALRALEIAIGLARAGSTSGIVTAPVSKAQLYSVGFTHPGQTEFIAERCGVARDNAVMLLAGPSLKVVPVTIHFPLKDVPRMLTTGMIVTRARVAARALERDFGIIRPRLAMAGLNPHAGEGGALGREEIDIITPALEILRAEGIDIVGPLSADTMFHARARADYDLALCCYHDQALIPVKTLHFDEGVNMTLGLPIVRTAPDHGTAFSIAGTGQANPGAMIAAIGMAGAAAASRVAFDSR